MPSDTLIELAMQSAQITKESPLAIRTRNTHQSLGIPKELNPFENRIPLTPDAVGLLVKNGIRVSIESEAGNRANYKDIDYANAGASIVYEHHEIFKNDIILKIDPIEPSEFDAIKPNSTLISTLNLPQLSESYFRQLNNKKITAIAFEFIEDKVGEYPIIRAMSEIAGSAVILIATEYLSSINNGKGIILGGITGVPPTNVVILGAGTVGEFAARTALGLGANIKVFDRQLYRLQRLQYAVGQRVFTSIIDSVNLSQALAEADVVIGALRGENGLAPMVVSEEMVEAMKTDSVIIDVAIDQGGCFETSMLTNHGQPVFRKLGVTHYCVPNIASRFAHTASIALSNIFAPVMLKTEGAGGINEMIFKNKWFMKGVVCHKGSMTNLHLAKKFNLKYKDLELLLSARL